MRVTVAVVVGMAAVAAGLVTLGCWLNVEAPVALLFGWIVFLYRVVPQIALDGPTLAVSATALLLFTAGVHWLGRRWAAGGNRRWRLRWTLALVAAMPVLFAAGVAVIGIAHQTGWLARSDTLLLIKTPPSTGLYASAYHLRYMGYAAHTYADTNGALPAGGTFTDDGRMLHGWAVHLLPYLIYDSRAIDLQRPWIDPVNAKAFRSVLPEFVNPDLRHPDLYDAHGFALSHYAANNHVLAVNRRMKLDEITDGTSVTLLIGEVNAGFKAWGHPLNVRDPAKGINHSPQGFGGGTGLGGARFLMADGSVRLVSERVSPAVLKALATPRGDEPIDEAALGWDR